MYWGGSLCSGVREVGLAFLITLVKGLGLFVFLSFFFLNSTIIGDTENFGFPFNLLFWGLLGGVWPGPFFFPR